MDRFYTEHHKNDEKTPIKPSMVLSAFLHSLLVVLWLYLAQSHRATTPPETVQVEWLDPKPKKSANDMAKDKAVVRTDIGAGEAPITKEAFLSDKDRRVDRETVAKVTDMKETVGASTQAKPMPKPKTEKQIKPELKAKAELKPKIALAKLGISMPLVAKPQVEPKPEWKDFAADFGGAHQEFVDGVKESETTALNTREFVFFSYFQRIRKQLDQAWQPILEEHVAKIFKKGRSLASEMHYKTSTVVTLNDKGEVIQVKVIQESGTFDLDEAAVEAFNRAGPFPNPPQALRDSQGNVEIKWDFILRT